MKLKQILINESVPNQTPVEELQEIYNEYHDEELFVHFSTIEQLTVNPKSNHRTPIGIYSYPLSYIIRGLQIKNVIVPFADDRDYMHVFATLTNEGVVTTEDYDQSDLENDIKRLVHNYFYLFKEAIDDDFEEFKQTFNLISPFYIDRDIVQKFNNFDDPEEVVQYFTRYLINEINVRHPLEYFWHIMHLFSRIENIVEGGNVTVIWNRMFRELGIMGVVDYGYGFIHPNEPTQAVFFNREVLEHIETVHNIDYLEKEDRAESGELLKLLKQGEMEEVFSEFERLSGTAQGTFKKDVRELFFDKAFEKQDPQIIKDSFHFLISTSTLNKYNELYSQFLEIKKQEKHISEDVKIFKQKVDNMMDYGLSTQKLQQLILHFIETLERINEKILIIENLAFYYVSEIGKDIYKDLIDFYALAEGLYKKIENKGLQNLESPQKDLKDIKNFIEKNEPEIILDSSDLEELEDAADSEDLGN